MKSKTEEYIAELEAFDIEEYQPRSFELYEEYSQKPITDTIRICKENFEKTDAKAKKELLTQTETEIQNFCAWLEETKNIEPTTAHYYSASLKSLLLGLPIGTQIAQLFNILITKEITK